ncbi:hypothetical protein [Synechococcus phage BUCT-ZZ01]|nr:hypothetical protein [Synechococcus phage BUCT-ZZ01]
MEHNTENLLKLAKFLSNLPDDYKCFDMSTYFFDSELREDRPQIVDEHCIACALGHGPTAGIGPDKVTMGAWMRYADTYFSKSPVMRRWIFSPVWARIDNTPKGAAQRILYAIKNGPIGGFDPMNNIVEVYKDVELRF